MFTSIKLKLYAGVVAAFSILLILLGRKNDQLVDLIDDNETKEKRLKIAQDMEDAQRLAQVKESESMDKIDLEKWRDEI